MQLELKGGKVSVYFEGGTETVGEGWTVWWKEREVSSNSGLQNWKNEVAVYRDREDCRRNIFFFFFFLRQENCLSPGVQAQHGQHSETSCL